MQKKVIKIIISFLLISTNLFASFTIEEWKNLKWKRYEGNPIMRAGRNWYEAYSIFNCAITVYKGKYYMFYRAENWDGRGYSGDKGGASRICLATSTNLLTGWTRYAHNPIIDNTESYEQIGGNKYIGGCEDPRIFRKDGTWYMTYTGWHGPVDTCMAVSQDLTNWTKRGPIIVGQKNGVILPVKLNGKYWMYWGNDPFYVAWCDKDDLSEWHDTTSSAPILFTGIDGYGVWDKDMETSAPPMLCEDGILFLYYGYTDMPDWMKQICTPNGGSDATTLYSLGWALTSMDDPYKVIERADIPFLTCGGEPTSWDGRRPVGEPTEKYYYEMVGQIYGADFGESLLRIIEKRSDNHKFKEKWYFFYSGADTYLTVATADGPTNKKVLKYHLPVLEPTWTSSGPEHNAVYNPTAITNNNKVVLLYTAREGNKKRICKATSVDGINNFTRYGVVSSLSPSSAFDFNGVENPGIFKIGGTYYLTYNGDDAGANKYDICLASSTDLNIWTKYGEILKQTSSWNSGKIRNGFIVPEKINGKYVMYFQGYSSDKWKSKIGIAYCDSDAISNINNWYESSSQPVLSPRIGYFDSEGIRPAGVPYILGDRIILFYNGWSDKHRIMMGWVAFSKSNPEQVVQRGNKYIIMPTEPFEGAEEVGTCGFIPFSGSGARVGYLYYGGGKKNIALALINEIEQTFGSNATISSAPTWVSATAVSSSQINLKWNDTQNETYYKLYRNNTNNNITATNIATLPINKTNYMDISLNPDTSYYYWLKAYYSDSGLSEFSSVISCKTFSFSQRKPKFVAGLKLIKSGNKNILSWSSVTKNNDNSDLTTSEITKLAYYKIYRSVSIDSSWNIIGTTLNTYYQDIVSNNELYYYKVTAVNKGGQESLSRFIVDSSANKNLIVNVVNEGESSYVAKIIIPDKSAEILYKANNGYKDDLWINIEKTSSEDEDIVGYYDVKMMKYTDDKVLSGVDFGGDVQYSFYYEVDPATGYIESTRMLLPEQADRFLRIYRHNGIEWVCQGGKVDNTQNCIVLNLRKTGRYAIIVKERAKEFTLTQLEPKKIFTPYGREPHNEMRFYFENPKDEDASCKIYSLIGNEIKTLPKKMLSDKDGYFFWDGKDDNNKIVASGVYIYQLECNGKKINGTVVLVK